ncbi:endo alpha-1,4 polygalactosaminidase [Phytomonospora sp. NPDC050363]|uniref:endo alpha-1,4 polygalactosaminidase n=1 Tax=Phytomonospora sp. NPDC050363 TaxID=3155642 RepID=UPI0033F6FB39
MRRILLSLTAAALALTACGTQAEPAAARPGPSDLAAPEAPAEVRDWVYQLSGYDGDGLGAIAAAPGQAAVFDLARDGGEGYWTPGEVGAVQASGKLALSYFTIGSIENYRPEADAVERAGLMLNQWGDWPDEHFVKYWHEDWWTLAAKTRVDQAIASGFDGAYLDVPNAYEEIDLALVPGETRETLARKMVDLIVRISEYAEGVRPGFLILPQNSPELQDLGGYTEAVDGIGVEELYYLATDEPCDEDWCAENRASVAKLKAAGKLILAVDYADDPAHIAEACGNYRAAGFAGYVAGVDLDDIRVACP